MTGYFSPITVHIYTSLPIIFIFKFIQFVAIVAIVMSSLLFFFFLLDFPKLLNKAPAIGKSPSTIPVVA